MALQRQHVTIVIGARAGQPPIYPQVGQGLLGGTIEQVHTGDSISQHKQLNELRLIFTEKFDRGELSPGMLQRVLWESNWWRAILPVVERAADLLHLASASGINAGGLAAQRCAEIEAALTAMTRERIPETPIGDALLRGEPVPLGDGLRSQELEASARRADGIRPLCEADPVGLLHHAQAAEDSGLVEGVDYHDPANGPLEITDAEADSINAKQWGAMVDYLEERLPAGWDEGGGFLVDKAIEALDALGLEPARKEAHATDGPGSTVGADDHLQRIAMLEETLVKTGYITLDRLESLERGLMALAKAIGPLATEQTLKAMERPA